MSGLAAVEAIRSAFPALERVLNGRPVAYFDGPGGTQVPRPVVDAMADYLYHHNANTHWNYPSSAETDAMLLRARTTFAAFLGARPDEIAFGNNMSTLTFHLARALGRKWQAGDEVIVTEIDHHANVAPWQALALERGIVLRWLPLDVETGTLALDVLPSLLNHRTRLVAVNVASNLLGTVTDVARVCALAHAAGALVFADGVHYAPHFLPDMQELGCDFFACSPYKFYGPHTGLLWGRFDLLATLDLPRLEPAPAEPPEHFETGTQNHEGIVGAAAAVEWIASLSGDICELRPRLASVYHDLHHREAALFAQLWNGLGNIPGIRRAGLPPGSARTATLSFTKDGVPSERIAGFAAERACFVSHGDFYASTIARRFGFEADGFVRIGAACYTTEEEIERVIAVARDAR